LKLNNISILFIVEITMALFPYTKNNHFKWGWADTWYGTPEPNRRYRLHLGHTTRPWASFREECMRAAADLASVTDRPILVGLSGGSDSQIVCISLGLAGVPYTALIVRYEIDGICVNQHDIATAYEFCEKYSTPYQELTVDIDRFYRDRAPALARKYCMPKLETIIQCEAMDWAGDDWCYIMGGGDIMLIPVPAHVAPTYDIPTYNNVFTVPCWWESPVPVMHYMLDQGYHGTSKFFLYTPELIASYLSDPITQDFLKYADVLLSAYIDIEPNSSNWWKCFHYHYKPMLTLREFPEIIPNRKFTGFEELYGNKYIPGKLSVYSQILKEAVRGLNSDQKILCPINRVLEYVTTPHDETHCLRAYRYGV